MERDNCLSCIYFVDPEKEEFEIGDCSRYPRKAKRSKDGWCGEYKRRKKMKAKFTDVVKAQEISEVNFWIERKGTGIQLCMKKPDGVSVNKILVKDDGSIYIDPDKIGFESQGMNSDYVAVYHTSKIYGPKEIGRSRGGER